MSALLDDETLTRLLTGAAASFEIRQDGADLALRKVADAPKPWWRSRRRQLQVAAAAAVVVLAVLILSALGGGAGTSGLSARVAASTSQGPASADADGTSAAAARSGSGAALAPAPAPQSRPVPAAGPRADAARVVKTGSLALIVDRGQVTPVLTATQAVIASMQGYVAASSTQESGATPSGTMSFRVPVANFERAVTRLRGLHATVRDAEASGRDVTAQYADTAAQVGSLKAARSRFLTILDQAKTIGETLSVQQRVDDVQGQIDRLEGQRRVLADQSDLATLTVTVTQKDDPAVQPPGTAQGGLGKAFHDAVHGFTSGAEALIARSGRVLLVLLALGALAVVLHLGWRVVRRRLV